MIVLAVDTALSACQAAILDTGTGRAVERVEEMARGHAEALMPLIASLMAESGVDFRDIDRFAVTVGPGTFTGVRVGVAAVRGLALATGRPAAGVTTLEALAGTARMEGIDGPLLVAMDARRDEVYAQAFGVDGRALSAAMAATARDAAAGLPADVAAVYGSGAGLVAAAGTRLRFAGSPAYPRCLAVASLAAGAADPAPPRPLYLRAPDAKPQTKAAVARR